MKIHKLIGLLGFSFFILSTLAAARAEETSDKAKAEPPPNVLFIAVDDLNDWTSFLGGYKSDVYTPNLDRLAARGVFFTHAYCAAPACNPSRAALLTGIRPSTSGVYHNPNPWRTQMPDAVTLPQHFMAGGYKVHGCGKIFHGGFKDPQSWQDYFARPGDPAPEDRPVNGIRPASHFDWGPLAPDKTDRDMGDTAVVDYAIDFLSKKHDRPYFLACGIFRPHLPWFAPQPYFDRYPLKDIVLPVVKEDDMDDIPELGVKMAKPQGDHAHVLAAKQWEKAVQGYLACITYTDGQIGRLLDALDKRDDADRTIIVLWGDHGWHLGEKLHWRKFSLWEEATRVPFVIIAPKVTTPGSQCDRTVSLMDIYPTLADLCGLPIGSHLEGDTLRPLLVNPKSEWNRPVVTTHGRNNHGVRSERWRYIRYSDGSEELYDHDNDPMEWTNLAGRKDLKSVKAELAKFLPKVNVPEGPRGQGKKKK